MASIFIKNVFLYNSREFKKIKSKHISVVSNKTFDVFSLSPNYEKTFYFHRVDLSVDR